MPIMVLVVVIAGVSFVLKRKKESEGQDEDGFLSASSDLFHALCVHVKKLFKPDRGASSTIRNIEHIILKKDETLIDKITALTMDTNLLFEEFRMLENVVDKNIDETKWEAEEDKNLSHNRYKDICIGCFIKLFFNIFLISI